MRTDHVEAATVGQTFTLGQLFAQWGVRLTPTQVRNLVALDGGTVQVISNGTPVAGDPAALPPAAGASGLCCGCHECVLTTRRRKRLVGTVAVLGLTAAGAWGGGAWNHLPAADRAGSVSRTLTDRAGLDTKPGIDLYPPGQRAAVPSLGGVTLDGDRLNLSELKGRIVVVNVWGSWCAPCRRETPDLVRLATEMDDRGVRFVGIDTRDTPAAAKAFMRSFKVPYPSLDDPSGEALLALQGVVPTSVVPGTIVVDRQGRLAARVIGPVTYTT